MHTKLTRGALYNYAMFKLRKNPVEFIRAYAQYIVELKAKLLNKTQKNVELDIKNKKENEHR
jgi:hypothetical protein